MDEQINLSDGEKAEAILQEFVDEGIAQAICDAQDWLDDNGVEVDFEYFEKETQPEGSIKVGNEILDVEYKVTRKVALEKREPK